MKKAIPLTILIIFVQSVGSLYSSQAKAEELPEVNKDSIKNLIQRHPVVTKKHDNETLNQMADKLLAPPTSHEDRLYLLRRINNIGKSHAGAGQRMVIDALIASENKYKTSQAASIRAQALDYLYISDTAYMCRDLTLEKADLPAECKKIPLPKRNGKTAFSRSIYGVPKLTD